MIRVTIELIPFGREDHPRRQVLASGKIANVGGTDADGKYIVELYDKAGRLWKAGHVNHFPRKRLLAWDLLYRALRSAIGDRNEEE